MNLVAKRILATAIGTLAGLAPVAGLCMLQAYDRATWQCGICCREEWRSVWFGLVLAREEIEPTTRRTDVSGSFNRWFDRRPIEHSHDWIPTGCHLEWDGSSSYRALNAPFRNWILYRSFPELPDQELARGLIARFVRQDAPTREMMIEDLQRDPGPFADVAEGKPASIAQFAAAYEDWSAAHPLWR